MLFANINIIKNIINNNKYELYGIFVCQNNIYETDIKNVKNIGNLLDDTLEWLYVEMNKLNNINHIFLLCKLFRKIKKVTFIHKKISDIKNIEIIKEITDIKWLIDHIDLSACTGLLWTVAMLLNNESLHLINSKLLCSKDHFIDKLLTDTKDLVTIGVIENINISNIKNIEMLYMSRHTHSLTNKIGNDPINRIYESIYTLQPESEIIFEGVKKYIETKISNKNKVFINNLFSINYIDNHLQNPKILNIKNENISVIKLPSVDNITNNSINNILEKIRIWLMKIEEISKIIKNESEFYSILAKLIGLQGSEVRLAGIVIKTDETWNKIQLRLYYLRILRDLAIALTYNKWKILYNESKIILYNYNNDEYLDNFVFTLNDKNIFAGYTNLDKNSVALLIIKE